MHEQEVGYESKSGDLAVPDRKEQEKPAHIHQRRKIPIKKERVERCLM